MNAITQSKETELWESALGVLPVRLFPSQNADIQQYIMLNGNKNNFGLDLEGNLSKLSPEDYRSYAWSADVDSFISIVNTDLVVHRWHRQGEERYPKQVVLDNIEKFYSYLEQTSQKKENAIVPYAIRTFRSLRNYLSDKENGRLSLQAFLYLLAAANERNDTFDLKQWGLSDEARTIGKSLPIEKFLDEFLSGLNHSKLRPDIQLILRHAAGKLFQEAHYEAVLTGQLNLYGTASSDILTSIPKYSSVHFTPSYIARSVVEESLNCLQNLPESLKILDPACGSGEFLKETLRQLKNRGYSGKIHVIGWDISQVAIDMAKFLLAFEKKEWGESLTINLENVEDSLDKEWEIDYDLILMNPPFVNWNHMNEQEQSAVRGAIGSDYRMKPNMAGAFLWKASNSLKDSGVMGCVLPSSILYGDSYSDLRSKVQRLLNLRLIAKLGNYIFQSSFTDACLLVASKNYFQEVGTKLIWTYNTANSASDAMRALRKQHFSRNIIYAEKDFSIYSVDDVKGKWMPMKYDSWDLKNHLTKLLKTERLKEAKNIFDIRLGARIGNPVFLVNNEFYESLKMVEKKYFRPVILNKAIKNGKLSVVSYLFFPKSSIIAPINSEEDLQMYVPFYYNNKLAPIKERLLERSRTDQKNWWHLSEARAWQYQESPKLISTEFGKAGSFAFDENGDFVVERGLAWLPKQSEKFTEETYFAYVALFCCSFLNELLSIYSKQIAGGEWWDLSKRYVQNIPIPDFTSDAIFTSGEFTELATLGKKLSKGENVENERLLFLVRSLYGLN